jgi:glycerol-3-phosphate acyltransferase PlsY
MLVIFLGAVLLAAYLVGSVPFGYLVGRWRGIDVLSAGSGNIGATNVGRLLGRSYGILVFVLDLLKGALPVLGAEALASAGNGLAPEVGGVAAGVAAFLGHLFPIFLRFRGGKGVATGAGIVAVLLPLPTLAALLFWVTVASATRFVSLASVSAAALLCLLRLATPGAWDWGWNRAPAVVTGFCLITSALVVVRHQANLRRLLAGTENRLKESRTMHAVSRILHLFAVGLWFGGLVLFTLTGWLLFHTFEELSSPDQRPYWFPTAPAFEKEHPGPQFPEPLRREQGSRLAGAVVTPQFPWYFGIQAGCAIVASVTALAWASRPGGRVHRLRALVLVLALGTVALGGWLGSVVDDLRGPRNELSDKVLTSNAPSTEDVQAAAAARARFGMWHGISMLQNVVTLLLVAVALALAAWLPTPALAAGSGPQALGGERRSQKPLAPVLGGEGLG